MQESIKQIDDVVKNGSWWIKVIAGLIIIYLILILICVMFWKEKLNDLIALGKDFGIPVLSVSVLVKTNNLLNTTNDILKTINKK